MNLKAFFESFLNHVDFQVPRTVRVESFSDPKTCYLGALNLQLWGGLGYYFASICY